MIEKMVLFENQKQLEETRDELERCKRFSTSVEKLRILSVQLLV